MTMHFSLDTSLMVTTDSEHIMYAYPVIVRFVPEQDIAEVSYSSSADFSDFNMDVYSLSSADFSARPFKDLPMPVVHCQRGVAK